MKRLLDIVLSVIGIVALSPVFICCMAAIAFTAGLPVIFRQQRVGWKNSDFTLFKFRTMYPESDKRQKITVGMRDPRITPVGYWLRKYKLDELPQLFNVLIGDMSMVGPRPELRHYVDMYTQEQLQVLQVRPGITDYASIFYHNENEVLATSPNPERTYIEEIMPHKLNLNLRYIENKGIVTDIGIILKTLSTITYSRKS